MDTCTAKVVDADFLPPLLDFLPRRRGSDASSIVCGIVQTWRRVVLGQTTSHTNLTGNMLAIRMLTPQLQLANQPSIHISAYNDLVPAIESRIEPEADPVHSTFST